MRRIYVNSENIGEHEIRIKLFKPVEDEAVIEWAKDNDYALRFLCDPPQFVLDAHEKECGEDCPWDGKTIFSMIKDKSLWLACHKCKVKWRPTAYGRPAPDDMFCPVCKKWGDTHSQFGVDGIEDYERKEI